MFSIKLILPAGFSRRGMAALEWRRRYWLADGVYAHTASGGPYLDSRCVTVDEDFARRHFGPEDTHRSVTVPWGLIGPGDIQCGRGDEHHVEWADAITDDRVRYLYESATVHALRERVADLERQVADLERDDSTDSTD